MWRVMFDSDIELKARRFRHRLDPFEDLEDSEFFERYRFSKEHVRELCQKFSPQLQRPTCRSQSLSVELQTCVALRYFSQGGYLCLIGDVHGISRSSTSRAIHNVSSLLCDIHKDFIKWPTREEFQRAQREFFSYSSFPKVIGAVDGCHVKIKSPSLPFNEATYVNRKGHHTINCHFACDLNMKIFDMSSCWPGSTHDSFMLTNSQCFEKREDFADFWLLGDSAYPQLTWLMTPFDHPRNDTELQYNRCHTRGRSTIERCNGLLKSRFRCLNQELNFSPVRFSKIVMACVCLHNFAVTKRLTCEIDDNLNMEPNTFSGSFVDEREERTRKWFSKEK